MLAPTAQDGFSKSGDAGNLRAVHTPFARSATQGIGLSNENANIGRGSRTAKSNRHTAILRDATREFSLLRRPEAGEIERYKELFYQLADRLEKSDRRLISAMLARSPFAPRPVAMYFAQDALEVAAPFLLFSPVLNDLDLRAIAAKKGRLYADVIARRKLPMEPFTAHKLSEANLAEEQLVTSQLSNAPVEAPVPSRPNVRDELINLAAKGGRTGRQVSNGGIAEKQATTVDSVQTRNEAAEPTQTFRLPKSDVRRLLSLARQRSFKKMAEAIEAHCALDAGDTLKILCSSKSDEPLYLIRALGIGNPHDIQLAMLTQPSIGRSIEAYRHAKKTLGELNQGICQIIFNEIGAQFDVPGQRQEAAPAFTSTPVEPTQKSPLHDVLLQRREAVQTRYRDDDRFAGGLADRWPGSSAVTAPNSIPMAG